MGPLGLTAVEWARLYMFLPRALLLWQESLAILGWVWTSKTNTGEN
jgi:hypothetical protein